MAGIMFVLVMALAIAGAREGLGLRLGLACLAYLIYLEWWTWHAVVWDVETGELDDDATGTRRAERSPARRLLRHPD